MALPATDDFNRADSTTTLGANWTVVQGVFGIFSNAAYPNSVSNEGGVYWNADAFGNDQYSEGTIAALQSGNFVGVSVRGATGQYYGYYTDGSAGYLFLWQSPNWTELGTTDAEPWAVNDVMRLEVEGTTLRIKRNGVTVRSVTDSSLTSGSPGLSGFSGFTGMRIDNWVGDNLSAPPAASGGALTPMRGIVGP